MRLLDQVAHHSTPFSVSVDAHGANEQIGRVTTVPGPADFAHRVAGCPLRYVLSDDLVAGQLLWHAIGTLVASKHHQVPRCDSAKCLSWLVLSDVE